MFFRRTMDVLQQAQNLLFLLNLMFVEWQR